MLHTKETKNDAVRPPRECLVPMSNWTGMANLIEVSPGQFQVTDPQAGTNRQRFYRVHAP